MKHFGWGFQRVSLGGSCGDEDVIDSTEIGEQRFGAGLVETVERVRANTVVEQGCGCIEAVW